MKVDSKTVVFVLDIIVAVLSVVSKYCDAEEQNK